MNELRIVIAEDERVVARRIARLTSEILAPSQANFSFARNIAEARSTLSTTQPDLLILDLNLEGEEGFALLRDASCEAFETIVVSAHTDRALAAFDHGVRDFVPKPFSRDRLERALQRAMSSARPERPVRFIGVRRQGETSLVPVDDVLFIEGAGTHSEIVLHDGRRLRHDKTLERLGSSLPESFERIHKSFIVDVRRIRKFIAHEGSRYSVELTNGTALPVGRTRVRNLRRRFT